MTPDWPAIFAARVLERMASFRSGTLPGAPSRPTERPIGVYDNGEPDGIDCVLVTSDGIHIRRHDAWESIGYAEIAAIHPVPEIETAIDKQSVWSLRLEARDGRSVEVPLRGRRDRYRDAFEFWRFLRNCTSEIASRAPAA